MMAQETLMVQSRQASIWIVQHRHGNDTLTWKELIQYVGHWAPEELPSHLAEEIQDEIKASNYREAVNLYFELVLDEWADEVTLPIPYVKLLDVVKAMVEAGTAPPALAYAYNVILEEAGT